jgi:hypothetical protein
VIRAGNRLALFIFSKEGITQGDPLAMAAYGISLLPLICRLKDEFHSVKQPWYANGAGAGGKFVDIRQYFLWLQEISSSYGYFPEPDKSILIVKDHNNEQAKAYFEDLGFKVVRGSRYLGGFLGKASAQQTWVVKQTEKWADAVGELSMVAERYPQAAYAGLTRSLQQEWQFLQRVTDGLSLEFTEIEQALRSKFLPALFGNESALDDTRRQLTCLPVKCTGIAIPNPTQTTDKNWKASTVV